MTTALQDLTLAATVFAQTVMSGIGGLDDALSAVMAALGVFSAATQLYVVLTLLVLVVVFILRAVGGVVGWIVLLLALLLVMHRTLPRLSSPALGGPAAQLGQAL